MALLDHRRMHLLNADWSRDPNEWILGRFLVSPQILQEQMTSSPTWKSRESLMTSNALPTVPNH